MVDRVLTLPKWAQEYIASIEKRLEEKNSPLARELDKLRPQVDLLTRRNEALEELLLCAAKGGHKTAAEIVKVLESYALTLTPNE